MMVSRPERLPTMIQNNRVVRLPLYQFLGLLRDPMQRTWLGHVWIPLMWLVKSQGFSLFILFMKCPRRGWSRSNMRLIWPQFQPGRIILERMHPSRIHLAIPPKPVSATRTLLGHAPPACYDTDHMLRYLPTHQTWSCGFLRCIMGARETVPLHVVAMWMERLMVVLFIACLPNNGRCP